MSGLKVTNDHVSTLVTVVTVAAIKIRWLPLQPRRYLAFHVNDGDTWYLVPMDAKTTVEVNWSLWSLWSLWWLQINLVCLGSQEGYSSYNGHHEMFEIHTYFGFYHNLRNTSVATAITNSWLVGCNSNRRSYLITKGGDTSSYANSRNSAS